MSKERLKEIQEKYDMWVDDYNLTPQDIEWLIEQTGRAIKNAEDLHVMDLQLASEQKQNKRYREALEFYANEENYFFDEKEYKVGLGVPESEITLDYGNKARKALKGDKQ